MSDVEGKVRCKDCRFFRGEPGRYSNGDGDCRWAYLHSLGDSVPIWVQLQWVPHDLPWRCPAFAPQHGCSTGAAEFAAGVLDPLS
jgi:hypothetical protein